MVPSDILIKTAVEAALTDLRKNKWLLDYVFMWLSNDKLTLSSSQYGQAEKDRAKRWFLNTEIFVSMNFRADDFKAPMISIGLVSSMEEKGRATLGDRNYETFEDIESDEFDVQPQVILSAFTPKSYDSSTGLIVLPDNLSTANIFAGNIITDTQNNIGYTITEVTDLTSFKIVEGVVANFTNAYIAPIDSFHRTELESSLFSQTYKLICFAQDPVHLLYLHAVCEFILLRYKQEYLEKRGFDMLGISSGPVTGWNPTNKDNEMTYVREVTFNGYVRQYWPKLVSNKIQGIKLHGIRVMDGPETPPGYQEQVEEQGWWMEGDEFEDDDESSSE